MTRVYKRLPTLPGPMGPNLNAIYPIGITMWIDPKERLPEPNQDVLLVAMTAIEPMHMFVGYYCPRGKCFIPTTNDYPEYKVESIKAWRPLPKYKP